MAATALNQVLSNFSFVGVDPYSLKADQKFYILKIYSVYK